MYIYVYSACSSARVDEETPPAVSLLASKMQPTNGGGGGAAAIIVGPRIWVTGRRERETKKGEDNNTLYVGMEAKKKTCFILFSCKIGMPTKKRRVHAGGAIESSGVHDTI